LAAPTLPSLKARPRPCLLFGIEGSGHKTAVKLNGVQVIQLPRVDGQRSAFYSKFSSAFHKQVSSSTVSAQGCEGFLLRSATNCHRVGSAKREQFLNSLDDCGMASGSRRFSRVNCRGTFQKMRASACWLPGRCGLLPRLAHWAGKGRWPPQSLQLRDRRITILRPLRENAALLVCAGRPEVSTAASRRTARAGTPRTMRLGWLARAAFVFPPQLCEWSYGLGGSGGCTRSGTPAMRAGSSGFSLSCSVRNATRSRRASTFRA
jgi:hypothetical protein